MSLLTDLEIRFVQDDLDVVQEFDVSSFASNAKSALTGKVEMVKLRHKISHYSKALEEGIATVSSMKVDKREIVEFLNKFKSFDVLDKDKMSVPDISVKHIGVLKPQYINQYTQLINSLINKVLNDNASQEEVDRFLTGDVVDRVKKQVVKTAYPEMTSADMVKAQIHTSPVMLNEKYIRQTLIPFVTNAGKERDALIAEATAVLHSIKEAEDNVNAMMNAINKVKSEHPELTVQQIRKVDYVAYNSIRGYMDVLSYVTYVMIRKLNEFGSNILTAERIYTDVMNRRSAVSEGVTNTILPSDTESVSEDLTQGKVDIFDSIATNLYNYHRQNPLMGMVNGDLKSTGDAFHSVFDVKIDMTGYSKKIYLDTIKMYIAISNGLDILARDSDEYLIIFDGLKKRAGFIIPLEDRFRSVLDAIEDMSDYATDVPGIKDQNMFANMLAEVKDYPENMQKIANVILDVQAKLDGVTDRFNNNINGEFKDAESLNELKLLMADIKQQFETVNDIVGTRFLKRLQTIGKKLTAITIKDEDPGKSSDTVPDVDIDHVDYRRTFVEQALLEQEMEHEYEMRLLQESYNAKREKALRGVLIQEADGDKDSKPTTSGGFGKDADGKSAEPTVNDSGSESNDGGVIKSVGNGIAKIIEAIKSFINTFLTNLQRSSTKNTNWVIENKQELLNRSYDNCTLNILPYQQLPFTQIIGKINEVTTIVRGLSPQSLQGINDKQEAYSRVLSPLSGGVSVTGSVSPETQIINFFTTGRTGGGKVVAIANGDLQRMVASEMIPFCESYAGQFNQSLQQALIGLANAADEATEKATQGAKPNETDNKNTAGNMSQAAKLVGAACKDLAKGVLNAVKQRNNDYLKGLSSLVPKTPATPAQPGSPAPTQAQAQAVAGAQTAQQQAVQPTVTGA